MNDKLRELRLEERIRLVEELGGGIAAGRDVLPVTPEQRAELDRRLDAFELDKNGDSRPMSWQMWACGCDHLRLLAVSLFDTIQS
jgi:putative addiction module component (TIGR02574 family)